MEAASMIPSKIHAAASVNVRGIRQWPVSGFAVELVAIRSQPGIVAAPLLTHEVEQVIRQIQKLADVHEVSRHPANRGVFKDLERFFAEQAT